jgi:hypothetical protein
MDTAATGSIAIEPSMFLWFFFWIGFAITAGFAFGLIYHWLRYGTMYPLALTMMPVYIVGVLVLIGAMLTGIATV